ncbi:multicopper oxidase family protein [Brevibacillus agri]|uniref:multicopper oxidase family protein n=1 Tax=Brevibacillus agri TaxID=51101 RepID=UPI003D19C6AA
MADFEVLAGIHQGLFLVLVFTALIPTLKAKALVYQPTRRALAKKARWTLFFVWLSVLAFAGQLFVTWAFFQSFGWLYIRDKALGFLPLMVVPLLSVLFISLPRLWQLAAKLDKSKEKPSYIVDNPDLSLLSEDAAASEMAELLPSDNAQPSDPELVDADLRKVASAPELIVPLQASVLGSLTACFLQFFYPAVTLEPAILLLAWGVLVAGTSALWIMQSWRQQRCFRPGEWKPPAPFLRFLRGTAVLLLVSAGIVFWGNQALLASKLPEQFKITDHTNIDTGHGTGLFAHAQSAHAGHDRASSAIQTVSVADLTGPREGEADRQFKLTAQKATVRLPSGKTMEAWTFNGQYPGPELRIKQGELVEVVLENKDIADGVTIHWHGLNVPNAEDGVAGATQDAVLPGEKHVYRFIAEQAGTFWYHSHQQASVQVRKGLFGALVIEPAASAQGADSSIRDLTVIHHKPKGEGATINGADTLAMQTVSPGTPVRLRFINAENLPVTYQLCGISFQVVAIDGNEVNEPNLIANQALELAAGGRYDLYFTMPDRPVLFAQAGKGKTGEKGLLLSPDGRGESPALQDNLPLFDPARYGAPMALPFDSNSPFDREYQMLFDVAFGMYDGRFDGLWTINGQVFPYTPMMMVSEGDLVKMTFVNRSFMDHPMHLHGHHMLVLTRNGKPVTGSPWWTDTLNVAPGETYEVAFRADNPGLWMDHCHNQDHAALGMSMHLLYEGVTSPYEAGHATRNHPE